MPRLIILLLLGLLRLNEAQDSGNAPGPPMPKFHVGLTRDDRGVGIYFGINWRPKDDISKYEIEYTKSSIPVLSKRVETTYRFHELNDVDFSFDYKIRMRAYNGSGPGPWSEEDLYFATSGRLGAPRNIHVRRQTPSQYSVTFGPPSMPPGISIRSFRLFTSDHATNVMSSWNRTDIPADSGWTADFTVGDPSKTYIVKLQARESDGRYGNLSDAKLPDDYTMGTPGKPRNFQGSIAGVFRNKMVFRWDHPTNWQFTGLTLYLLE